MFAQILFMVGCVPLILLGGMHLIFTLKDNRVPRFIVPRSNDLIRHMKAEPLRLTSETDMWRAWIGFNISHSMAVLMVGLGYLYLTVRYYDLLVQDTLLL